jgi:anti-sigma factor RsiW
MNHPSQLVCSMYVDRALAADEAADTERHLASCAECRARVAGLEAENRALRAALLQADAEDFVAAPPWRRGLRLLDLLGLSAAAAATAWTSSVFWSALVAVVPSSLRWLSPLDPRALWDYGIDIVVFIANEGSSMLNSISSFATVAAFAAVLGGAAAALRKQAGAAALLSALLIVLALPSTGHAFELRRSKGITTVPAGETIDDTLIALGDTVSIEGDVHGDLLAFGRRVTVRGNVMGDVVSGAETVEISGTVGGNVIAAGNQVSLVQARVAGNVYSGGRGVRLDNGTEITGNAVTAASDVDVAAHIGIDLRSYGRDVNFSGNVTRNVGAYGETVTLVAPARIGGDLTAHVSADEKLQIANAATIGGNVVREVSPRPGARQGFGARIFEPLANRYATVGFYFGQMVRLAAAFVTGLLLLAVFPALQLPPLRSGIDLLRAGGIGLATAIVAPIAALIACVTVILAPVGIIGFVVGAIALYLAKIPIAQLVGLLLFKSKPHYAASLLAGLAVVIVAVNLPLVGWLFGVVITCVGLGMLVMHALDATGRGSLLR